MNLLRILLLLSAPLVVVAADSPIGKDSVLRFERGPLSITVSSDDWAHPEVLGSQWVVVSCRTSTLETTSFVFTLRLTLDGRQITREAKIPRLPNMLVLPPVSLGLIANAPWTTFRFFIPAGAILNSVSVEQRVDAETAIIEPGS